MKRWKLLVSVGVVGAGLAAAGACGADPQARVTAGCPSPSTVMTLLATRPGAALPSGAAVALGPVCDGDWAFASVGAPDLEDVGAVLRFSSARWQVLTYGSQPCAAASVRAAPPPVRAAAGC
jgi:hypothetical protein